MLVNTELTDAVANMDHSVAHGDFENGDIVTIAQVGNEDEPNCYGAISPYDGMMWYLYDDEVDAATNADHIRSMGDDELSRLLYSVEFRRSITGSGAMWEDVSDCLHWLKSAKSE